MIRLLLYDPLNVYDKGNQRCIGYLTLNNRSKISKCLHLRLQFTMWISKCQFTILTQSLGLRYTSSQYYDGKSDHLSSFPQTR